MRDFYLVMVGVLAFCAVRSETVLANDSVSLMGVRGLNTVPSARMDAEGTLRTTVSNDGHYTHGSVGVQISDRLYIGLRQSADDTGEPHFYPGMDLKYRLFRERYYRPEISVGIQSAFGHKRFAAEYLALSKKYKDFDFTLGVGWGRMGTRQHLPNPLLLHSFSGDKRSIHGEDPNTPSDWFSGDVSLFGGLQYDLPIDGLSLIADWSGDNWKAERLVYDGFDAPAPWSIGLSYQPLDGIGASVAMMGRDTIMARLSFSSSLKNWAGRDSLPSPSTTMNFFRTEVAESSNSGAITIKNNLDLVPLHSTAFQIGEAARQSANMAGPSPEEIGLALSYYGLKGPYITINRRDLEQAHLKHQGSAEEIWHNVSLSSFLPEDLRKAHEKFKSIALFKIDLVEDMSLSEDDAGLLYRSAVVPSLTTRIGNHFIAKGAVRINYDGNLDSLSEYRGVSLSPVRGDIDLFSEKTVLLDRGFLGGLFTLSDDLHAGVAVGYLEEMYGGVSGEILYRPFEKNWAIGLELGEAFKRDPLSSWATGFNDERVLSGHINGYYEIPDSGATIHASLGRYLARDFGGSLSLTNEFENGVRVKGFVTATNRSDRDVYGGTTNFYSGVNLSLPLGSLPFMFDGSRAEINFHPLGRDSAERLDNPISLYDMTEPISYRGITRHWSDLVQNAQNSP